MTEKCIHIKVYSNMILASNPPQIPWICEKCGEEGTERGAYQEDKYSEIKQKFHKLT